MSQATTRRTITAGLTGVLLTACLTACADQAAPATGPKSPNAVDSGPERVALDYTRAVARGDFKAAIPLVAPSQRVILEAITLGQGPGTLPQVTGDVSVGEVVENGNKASVSILGKMCRTEVAPRSATSAPPTDCIENHDPKTDSPVFLVHLAREDATGWKVIFSPAAGKPGPSHEG